MPLFQPSTKAVSAAAQEIADTVGASGDGEMTARAGRSLNAALQHFNNKYNWNFALFENPPVRVFAPFTVTGVTASAGQASAAAPLGHGIKAYDFIAGSGFGAGIRVSASAVSGFGIFGTVNFDTGQAVVDPVITRDMYELPTDYKDLYSARLLTSQKALRPVGRRMYDRSVGNEQQTTTSMLYDLFMVGGAGRIRILPPPAQADILLMRYYRRLTIPTTTATADAIDIPQDYEGYLMAWAKWHFLVDKSEGRGDQLQTWHTLGEEGLKVMLADQTDLPDQDLMFHPGQFQYGNISDTATWHLNWNYSSD
jgi:hypothetical protein